MIELYKDHIRKKSEQQLMSWKDIQKEREKYDIENYLILFKKFFLVLAGTSTVVFLILINLWNSKIAVMAYSIYLTIMLIWFAFKGNKFKKDE